MRWRSSSFSGLAAAASGQRQRLGVAPAALQHAHPPVPAAGPGAGAIGVKRAGPVLAPLAGIADLVQQLRAPRRQPGLRAVDRVHVAGQLVVGPILGPGAERLAAQEQGQVDIDVGALLEGARGRLEGHRLVLEHAQVGQHEFGPVLVQVAEEHQPQPVAQCVDPNREHAIAGGRQPGLEGLLGLVLLAQCLQPVALARAPGRREALRQLGPRGQREYAVERQQRRRVEPAQRHQRLGRRRGRADLLVIQLALAEIRPAAHQHAHQQRARGARQGREIAQEGALGDVEQVVVAFGEPAERTLEVVEVVERVRRWRGDGG